MKIILMDFEDPGIKKIACCAQVFLFNRLFTRGLTNPSYFLFSGPSQEIAIRLTTLFSSIYYSF